MKMKLSIFDKIIEPMIFVFEKDSKDYKLNAISLATNIMLGVFNKINSISSLAIYIKSIVTTHKKLNFTIASKSMYSEAFVRINSSVFRKVFFLLLEKMSFIEIPEIKNLGKFLLIDGSIFPAIKTMAWATYKKKFNAIKLHLVFELNRMIPVQFISTDANSSEKNILIKMIEKGVTYIADRGYISFNLFKHIRDNDSNFIIRLKTNSKYKTQGQMKPVIPEQYQHFFDSIYDNPIIFKNDKNKYTYRLVNFVVNSEVFMVLTDRFDLTTYEIIMLYAYRWQIELLFRFIKRTVGGIHLMTHNPNGIEIQIFIYLIAYLLLLNFKQKHCIETQNNNIKSVSNINSNNNNKLKYKSARNYVCGLVTLLGEKLQLYWKLGLHWLIKLRSVLFEPFNDHTLVILKT